MVQQVYYAKVAGDDTSMLFACNSDVIVKMNLTSHELMLIDVHRNVTTRIKMGNG